MLLARAEIWWNNLIYWSVDEVQQLILELQEEFKNMDFDGLVVINSTTLDSAKAGRTTVITLETFDQTRHHPLILNGSSSVQEYYRLYQELSIVPR